MTTTEWQEAYVEAYIEKEFGHLVEQQDEFTEVAWLPPAEGGEMVVLDYDIWQDKLERLQAVERSLPWWLGDLLNYGEAAYGETYAQAVASTGLAVERLRNYKWVAGAVDKSIRIDPSILSWSAHRQVAGLDPAEQERWLELALLNKWSSHELTAKIRAQRELEPTTTKRSVKHFSFASEVRSAFEEAGFEMYEDTDEAELVEILKKALEELVELREMYDAEQEQADWQTIR